MSCNNCQQIRCNHSTHYDVANVKERFIPTYAHDPIFTEKTNTVPVRCTPTFHSSVLDVTGYQPTTNQHLKKTQAKIYEKTVYFNDSKNKKQADLNPRQEGVCSQKVQWFDPAKEQLFDKLACCTSRYSRERKMADLSSNPVFGGTTMIAPDCSETTAHFQVQPEESPQSQVQAQAGQVEENKEVPLAPEQQAQIDAPEPETKQQQPLAQTKAQIKKKEQKPAKKQVPASKVKTQTKQPKKAQTKKIGPTQKYNLKQDVNLCTRGCSAGRKIAKSIVLEDKPTFTVIRR